MDTDPMMRCTFIATSLVVASLVACATAAHDAQPETLPVARDAAQRVLAFLSDVQSSADFSDANVEKQMGVTLTPNPSNGEGWKIYQSPDFGKGWKYGVQQVAPRPPIGSGFLFWFENADRAADAAPVCTLTLDQLRAALTTHGWVERSVLSEIGSVLAIEFAKRDLVLTLTSWDVTLTGERKCVLNLTATGGH
jgi:hypothetical protein